MSDTNSAAPVAESAEAPEQTESSEVQQTQQEQQPPAPPSKKKYTYKADGESVEEELDEAEIAKRLSLSKSAMKRMSEAAKTKQQAEALIREFQENPTALFKKLDSKKARSAAEEFLLEQLEQEMMSPEQKAQQEMLKKLQAYEEQEKRTKEEMEAKQMAQLQASVAQDYDRTITEALATSGLPKVPSTVKRMASLLYKNLELGLDLTPADLVEEVKKSYYAEFKELFGAGDASFILSMFGEDVSNKIRKHDLEKFKTTLGQNRAEQFSGNANPRNEEPPKKIRSRDYDEYLRKKIQKG